MRNRFQKIPEFERIDFYLDYIGQERYRGRKKVECYGNNFMVMADVKAENWPNEKTLDIEIKNLQVLTDNGYKLKISDQEHETLHKKIEDCLYFENFS